MEGGQDQEQELTLEEKQELFYEDFELYKENTKIHHELFEDHSQTVEDHHNITTNFYTDVESLLNDNNNLLEDIKDNTIVEQSEETTINDGIITIDPEQFETLNQLLQVNESIHTHLFFLNTVTIPGLVIIVFGWWFLNQFLR